MSSEAFPFNYKHGLWSTNDENRQFLYLFLRQLYSLEAFTIKTNAQQFFSHANVTSSRLLLQSETMSTRKRMKMNAQLCERAKIFVCAKKAKTKSKFSWTSFPHRMFFFQLIFGGAQRHIHFLEIPFLRQLIFYIAQRISIFVEFLKALFVILPVKVYNLLKSVCWNVW